MLETQREVSMATQVRIARNKGGGSTNGVAHDPSERVYVTGPHFTANREAAIEGRTQGIFSSTTNPDNPETMFSDAEAKRLLEQGHWSYLRPEIERR
jgi:hypothetical protein